MRAQRLQRRADRKVLPAEVVRDSGEQRLSAMGNGEQAGDVVERVAEIVATTRLGGARVKRHAYVNRQRVGPGFGIQRLLSGECRGERFLRRRKRRAERVAHRLEYV